LLLKLILQLCVLLTMQRIVSGGQHHRKLFLDDTVIESTSGLTRTLQLPGPGSSGEALQILGAGN
jgi:hypothetical protein